MGREWPEAQAGDAGLRPVVCFREPSVSRVQLVPREDGWGSSEAGPFDAGPWSPSPSA
jgi:hypothetical protein